MHMYEYAYAYVVRRGASCTFVMRGLEMEKLVQTVAV